VRNDSANEVHVYDTPDKEETGAGSAVAALARLRTPAYVAGFFGVAALVVAMFMDPRAFYTSYFFGYFFWMTLTLGATTLTYLHHTVRGAWGIAILRVIEAANKTLPLMGLLFIPIAVGMWLRLVYPWTDPEAVAHSGPMQHRYAWMNPWAWTIRAVIYFAFWIITTNILNKSSAKQDRTLDQGLARWRQSFAPPIGVLHVVLLTFAYTDWLMSLDPMWFSTIFGVIFMVSGILSCMALGTLIVSVLSARRPYSDAISPAIVKDLGNLLLGFTMFWAYVNLSQFLIIWSGNLPEEIVFYANRFTGPLVGIGALIIVGQFLAPFLMLLSGRTKRTVGVLKNVALLILVMRVIDVWWQVTPFFRAGSGPQYLLHYGLDILAWLGIGGVWLGLFIGNLRGNTLLPAHDTRLQEAKAHSHA
jgi:hypothetical protein